ncbi:MAG: YceD family protein [Actinomycetota bacterium]|nr:YceD family protein [Actinomycetota bacterium]
MAILTDSFDLGGLRMSPGEGRRLELAVSLDRFELGGESYAVTPAQIPVTLEISRTTQSGYALRLRFAAGLAGPCMRCLTDAAPGYVVDAWEISQPSSGDELESPYLVDGALELRTWAHDALALVLGAQILCRPDCPGLCPECGIRLDDAEPAHGHEPAPDPRWAKLSELHFDA